MVVGTVSLVRKGYNAANLGYTAEYGLTLVIYIASIYLFQFLCLLGHWKYPHISESSYNCLRCHSSGVSWYQDPKEFCTRHLMATQDPVQM